MKSVTGSGVFGKSNVQLTTAITNQDVCQALKSPSKSRDHNLLVGEVWSIKELVETLEGNDMYEAGYD